MSTLACDTLDINRPSGGYIVAPSHGQDVKWGYVLQNSVIRPHKGINVKDVWLGRPWKNQPKTVYINTRTYVNIPAKGWYNTMGGLPVLWVEYNTVDANGNPLDLSQRETYYYYVDDNTGKKVETFDVKNTLTAEEAAQYTVKNVLGGTDNWQPDLMCEACEAPVVKGADGRMTWEPVPYAICYVVTKNGEVVGMTTDVSFDDYTETDKWQVQAVNENGGLSPKGVPNQASAIGMTAADVTGTETVYTVDGRRHSGLQHGLNIVRRADGRTVKVVK